VQVVGVVVPLPCAKAGTTPPRFAPVAVAKVTFTTPLECVVEVLLGWHSVQATGLYDAPAACGLA
jgi:hypothetical protein